MTLTEKKVDQNVDDFHPRYDLSAQEVDMLQTDLIDQVRERTSYKNGLYAVWIDSENPVSNLIRTFEANTPEFRGIEKVVNKDVEDRSLFFAIVDTRDPKESRVVHGTRISGEVFYDRSKGGEIKTGIDRETNFISINELVGSDQDFTFEDFRSYYSGIGVDLDTCISVETNFTVGERVESDVPGVRISDLGYIALFMILEKKGLEVGESSVFAFVNEKTIKSLGKIGIGCESLAGRPDLKVPDLDGGFSAEFIPVRIPATQAVSDTLSQLKPFALEEIELK